MPASPVSIRTRHAFRLARDVLGHWNHNGVCWPAVLVVVAAVVLLVR